MRLGRKQSGSGRRPRGRERNGREAAKDRQFAAGSLLRLVDQTARAAQDAGKLAELACRAKREREQEEERDVAEADLLK